MSLDSHRTVRRFCARVMEELGWQVMRGCQVPSKWQNRPHSGLAFLPHFHQSPSLSTIFLVHPYRIMAPQPAVKTPRGKPPRDKREAAIKYNERRNFRRRMARVESDNRRAAAMEAAKVDHITSAKPRTPPVHMGRDYWKNKSKVSWWRLTRLTCPLSSLMCSKAPGEQAQGQARLPHHVRWLYREGCERVLP